METDSEKYHRFSDVCKELNQSMESLDKMIKKLTEMSHELLIIAKFELELIYMEKKEIREFANSYGWEEGVADLLHMATNADTAEDPESIWKKVGSERFKL